MIFATTTIGDDCMTSKLRKIIDGVDISNFRLVADAAYQLEPAIGKLESTGTCTIAEADDGWSYFCQRVIEQFNKDIQVPDELPTTEQIQDGLYNNFFNFVVLAAVAIEDKALPLCSWAAFNKHMYQGFEDEIACLRFLLSNGFDANAADHQGMTALHYMSTMQVPMQSHPRAVRLLLAAGANPNLQNKNGDTPLCYMSGNRKILPALEESFYLLLAAGADPTIAATDGTTAISLLKSGEKSEAKNRMLARMEKS